MRVETKFLLVLLASSFAVVACGQKGPLYLPGRSSTFESMVPEQQPQPDDASAQDASDEDDDDQQTDNIN